MGPRDTFAPAGVVRTEARFEGRRWDVRTDTVLLTSGETVVRDYLVHPGAVGIIALNERDEVLLVHQYRHPVGYLLWEPPAGLMDVSGESALHTAQRELVEEAGLVAGTWNVLADWFNSPGGSSEAFRCFLARDLADAPGGRPRGAGEEADMPVAWVPLDEAVSLVLRGGLQNPTAVAGLATAWIARQQGWQGLRPADAPWESRAHLLDIDRISLPDA